MEIRIADNRYALGKSAAHHIAEVLRTVIAEKGHARIVLSTGASQFDTLEALTKEEGIAWERVEMFHLDEYIGLPRHSHIRNSFLLLCILLGPMRYRHESKRWQNDSEMAPTQRLHDH